VIGRLALAVVVLPIIAEAQLLSTRTPAPMITAEQEAWQLNSEPLSYAGIIYYPAGPTVFFDGQVMVQVSSYRGVPLYADTTLEPYSYVYVPVGGALMRPYERPRAGELAGTVGPRSPWTPIERDGERSVREVHAAGIAYQQRRSSIRRFLATPESRPDPAWDQSSASVANESQAQAPREERQQPLLASLIPVTPPPSQGVWIEFDGRRWYGHGPVVAFDAARFVRAGNYKGFQVYRERGRSGRIFVEVVPRGPLAPYSTR
jgi:hypothetical protein